MAGKKGARLRTMGDVASYLARLINRLDREEIPESKAGKLGYLCNLLKGTLEASDLEKRLEVLEAQRQENNHER
jgi:hypothetical protein